jgi:eukaryotic-like serine/threonine-protein kinase
MGDVWKGTHGDGADFVAVKLLKTPLTDRRIGGPNFRGELGVISGLNHPAIVRVYDGGHVTPAEAGRSKGRLRANAPWLAMEWASGGTLERAANWEVLEVALRDILAGLAHAHSRRVIHLDVKPSNILEASSTDLRPGWKLADFGISRWTDDDASRVVQGTPAFMAPEQFKGEQHRLGPPTDLYALGCTVWLLICGKKPYPGRNSQQIGLAHLSGSRLPFRPRYPVPRHLEMWLAWLMSRDPTSRPQFARDALEALDELGEVVESRTARAADTVSTFSTQGQLTTFEFMAPVADEVEVLDIAPVDFGQAPLPWNWRAQSSEVTVRDWELGLGVYDLREVPFVGRESERDVLWEALRSVHERSRPRSVVIRGASGCGKSKLATWLAERAVELGAAQAIYAHHSLLGGPTDGIGAALGRSLGLHKATAEVALAYLRSHPGVADDLEAHVLHSLVHRNAPVVSAFDRHTPVVNMLTQLSVSRPLVLVVDDAQWGPEGLVVVQRIMRRSKARILVLVTARTESLAERPDAIAVLDALGKMPRNSVMEISPLPDEEHRQFIDCLLPLEPKVARRLQERTLGNPLFAHQLLGDWVARRLLVPGKDGLQIRPGADLTLPDSLHSTWIERLGDLFDLLGPAARTSVELAACLGEHVDVLEWRATCVVGGVTADLGWLDAIVDAGLARRTDTGFAFVHGILRESIERMAREAGRAAELHRCCADALWDASPRSRQRQAKHRIAAGDFDQALAPLLDASKGFELRGDLESSRAAYLQWEETARALGLDSGGTGWLRGVLRRSGIEHAHGRFSEARELALHVAERGVEGEGVVIKAMRGLGEAALCQGDLGTAIERLKTACVLAKASRMRDENAFASMALAEALLLRGERQEAAEVLQGARQRIVSGAQPNRRVQLLRATAFMALHDARFEAALDHYAEACQIAEASHLRIDIGLCEIGSGDVHRLSGHPDVAARHYEKALLVFRPAGPLRTAQVQLAQAENALALAEYGLAASLARSVRTLFAGSGRRRELMIIDGILGIEACVTGSSTAFERISSYLDSVESDGSSEPGRVWLLSRCAVASLRVDSALGARAVGLAIRGWQCLGWEHEAERVARLSPLLEH